MPRFHLVLQRVGGVLACVSTTAGRVRYALGVRWASTASKVVLAPASSMLAIAQDMMQYKGRALA